MLLDRSGADPNERIVDGRTLLSFAAETNATRVVELLLAKQEINVDPADDRGATPLWYATWSGWSEVVRLLIATGKVNVNATATPPNLFAADYYEATEDFDDDFIEPMSMCNAAFRKLQVKLTEDPNEGECFFSDQGDKQEREEAIALVLAVPELDFPKWHSLLYHTARHGPPEITRLILQRAEARDLLWRDVNGTVKIFALAAEMGQVGVVDALLEFGVAVDTRDEGGRTPLSLAAERTSYTTVLRRLIANGADVESQDWQGNTPLFYALSIGREENIDILTSHGASLSRITPEKITHLVRHAAETGNLRTMRYLLAAGVDFKSSQYRGLMPLAHAAMQGQQYAVAWLAGEAGIDVNARDAERGWTALHFAINNGSLGDVRTLLTIPAIDINRKDYAGLSPVAFAASALVREYDQQDSSDAWRRREAMENRTSSDLEIITTDLLQRPDAAFELVDAGSVALDALLLPIALKGYAPVLKLLLGRWGAHVRVTEDMLVHTARWGTAETLLLLVRAGRIRVTEKILQAAVLNQMNGSAILRQSVKLHGAVITKRLAIAAAGHGSVSTMQFVLDPKGANMRVTDEHLITAARKTAIFDRGCRGEIISLLLKERGRGGPMKEQETIQAGIRNARESIGAVQLLLDSLDDHFLITESLVALAWHAPEFERGVIMRMLLRRFRTPCWQTRAIILFAVETTIDAYDTEIFLSQPQKLDMQIPQPAVLTLIRRFGGRLLQTIFSQGFRIYVDKEVVEVAASHEEGREIMEILLRHAVAVHVTADVVPSIEGEKSGLEIIRLLKERGLIPG
ncbi:ankyrin repeat-containing domain protein [Aspergillus keveii]|uniref:Ankyrin repeat-containing domain protein n=1 Tax=Aspergillus keveii TaxID=714993 RepID=A0ABR4FJV3_9EURO